MISILALTIICKWWMLLALITIGSGIYSASKTDMSGFIPDFITPGIWIICNLLMWLVYFIIV